METLLTPAYQIPFVALSYVIALIGSFVALTSARGIVEPNGKVNLGRALSTGVALGGVGVWSMHFIGMLALRLNVGMAYSMVETLASLGAAIVASSIALAYVAKAPEDFKRILVAGTLLGLGVAAMHYLGMSGMRFGGFIRWSFVPVGISIAIAIVAATAALWLAFNTRSLVSRIGAAAVMGAAVCAMHYTGMTAADFICTTTNVHAIPDGFGVISAFTMPVWVIMLSIATVFLIFFSHIMSLAESAARPAAHASRY